MGFLEDFTKDPEKWLERTTAWLEDKATDLNATAAEREELVSLRSQADAALRSKEGFLDRQQFEKAAEARDIERRLHRRIRSLEEKIKARPKQSPGDVIKQARAIAKELKDIYKLLEVAEHEPGDGEALEVVRGLLRAQDQLQRQAGVLREDAERSDRDLHEARARVRMLESQYADVQTANALLRGQLDENYASFWLAFGAFEGDWVKHQASRVPVVGEKITVRINGSDQYLEVGNVTWNFISESGLSEPVVSLFNSGSD